MSEKYCDYYDAEFCEKYGNLTYADGEYYTKIVGNTFYLMHNNAKDESYNFNLIEKILLRKLNLKHSISALCIIPMLRLKEKTIRDVLRAWNFNVKYEWLDENLDA